MPQQFPARSFATPADHAACRAMLRGGSRSFHFASKFLPAETCDAATALYAFCRLADDLIDQDQGGSAALEALHERLRLVYAGRPLHSAADRALADILPRYAIPQALLDALLEGFAWDATRRRYEDISALSAYATRVAGTVGAMMALLMGARAPAQIARAIDLGVAMQLSNIARDVGEDARAGRLYLPLGWLRDAGIDPDAWLANPVFTPALGSVIRRVLDAADVLYRRAEAGIRSLPRSCRPGIRAARALYAEIGRQVERNGHDSIGRRAVVPGRRKLWVLTSVLAPTLVPTLMPSVAAARQAAVPVLPEASFLVDAVLASPVPRGRQGGTGGGWVGDLDERVDWVVALFARLERAELGETRPST